LTFVARRVGMRGERRLHLILQSGLLVDGAIAD
jgi:hypothetical protein